MKTKTLLLIASAALLTRCMPATVNASAHASLADSLTCAAGTLGSMGYEVVAADERNHIVKAERPKHVSNPFSGAMDADRITVFLGDEQQYTSMQIIGETVGTRAALRFVPRTRRIGGLIDMPSRDGGLVRKWTSREVAGDTEALAQTCGR